MITTGQSCNIAVPLTAIPLTAAAGNRGPVVRRAHGETKRVETGRCRAARSKAADGLVEATSWWPGRRIVCAKAPGAAVRRTGDRRGY